MAQIFKSHILNSDGYPMPDRPRGAAGGQHQPAAHDTPPEELAAAAFTMDQLVQLVRQMQHELEAMAASLRSGAQEQGYREGIERAHAEMHEQLAMAADTLLQAQRDRHAAAQAHAGQLSELALKISRKVIGAHLQADPTLVARIVEETVAELEATESLTVHVNAADLETVERSRPALERLLGATGGISIVADDQVDRGGCIVVSRAGEVDARISTKLGVLEAAFAAQRTSDAGG